MAVAIICAFTSPSPLICVAAPASALTSSGMAVSRNVVTAATREAASSTSSNVITAVIPSSTVPIFSNASASGPNTALTETNDGAPAPANASARCWNAPATAMITGSRLASLVDRSSRLVVGKAVVNTSPIPSSTFFSPSNTVTSGSITASALPRPALGSAKYSASCFSQSTTLLIVSSSVPSPVLAACAIAALALDTSGIPDWMPTTIPAGIVAPISMNTSDGEWAWSASFAAAIARWISVTIAFLTSSTFSIIPVMKPWINDQAASLRSNSLILVAMSLSMIPTFSSATVIFSAIPDSAVWKNVFASSSNVPSRIDVAMSPSHVPMSVSALLAFSAIPASAVPIIRPASVL